jgi:hypothetical protein
MTTTPADDFVGTEGQLEDQTPIESGLKDGNPWKPIATAPTSGQFLVTSWEPGDPWCPDLEVVNGPFLKDGRIANQNSGQFTRSGVWLYWMPLPPPPYVAKDARTRDLS